MNHQPSTVSTDPQSSAGFKRRADWLRSTARQWRSALVQDVWDVELGALSWARRTFVRVLRIGQLVVRGFRHDECMLHASSLTFITLLAIVPVLALALSMARVFGAGDHARDQLKALAHEWLVEVPAGGGILPIVTIPPGPEPSVATTDPTLAPAALPESPVAETGIRFSRVESLIDTAFERIDGLNFRALGGLGLVFLLWTVIGVLGQVEAAFNRVWGVTEHRPLLRKFTDYLSVLIVVPFLFTAASSIPAAAIVARLMPQESGSFLLHLADARLLRAVGVLVLLTLSFSFLLRFLPHAHVRLVPSLVGGLTTAFLSLGWLRLCTAFQIGVASNSAFFGSFATVPILLSWVYVSWEILLFGAEVAFAVQNADTYRMEQGADKASMRARLMVAVDLLATAARQLRVGDGLLRIPHDIRGQRISVRLVNDVVHELVQRELLAEVAHEPGAFAVRRDVTQMTVAEVACVLLDTGVQPAALGCAVPALLHEDLDAGLRRILPQRVADVVPRSPASAVHHA